MGGTTVFVLFFQNSCFVVFGKIINKIKLLNVVCYLPLRGEKITKNVSIYDKIKSRIKNDKKENI